MQFLYHAPAILHKDALIIGDTHFGMEDKLRYKGIHNENFTEQIFEKIKKLLQETKAKKLILLGDVKENITTLDKRTADTITKLKMLTEVIIVKGNHDGGIEETNANVIGAEGFVYEGIGLLHGHSWPGKELMKCKTIVCAHQHPVISFVDKSGKRHNEAVWVVAKGNKKNILEHYEEFNEKIELILIPAYNPLVGSALNFYSNKHLGPLLNNKLFKLDDALVFRLDGNSLGKLKKLKA